MASAKRGRSRSLRLRPWSRRIPRHPCSSGSTTKAAAWRRKSSRLAVLGEIGELAQDFGRAHQTFFRRFPFLEEHHLHVGPHPRSLAVLTDEIDKPIRLREFVVAEGDHRALRPGIDLLDIGFSAIGLDCCDLEEI